MALDPQIQQLLDQMQAMGMGDAYARRLASAGVPVAHVPCPGMIHGFFGMGATVDAARDALDRAGAALRDALGAA